MSEDKQKIVKIGKGRNSAADVESREPDLLDRLLGGRQADPQLADAARERRRELVDEYGADSALTRAHADAAAASYFLNRKVTAWTAALADAIDDDLFGEDAGRLPIQAISSAAFAAPFYRIAEQVRLQERTAKMLGRSLAALEERRPARGGSREASVDRPRRVDDGRSQP
jgi:hypothetical protein